MHTSLLPIIALASSFNTAIESARIGVTEELDAEAARCEGIIAKNTAEKRSFDDKFEALRNEEKSLNTATEGLGQSGASLARTTQVKRNDLKVTFKEWAVTANDENELASRQLAQVNALRNGYTIPNREWALTSPKLAIFNRFLFGQHGSLYAKLTRAEEGGIGMPPVRGSGDFLGLGTLVKDGKATIEPELMPTLDTLISHGVQFNNARADAWKAIVSAYELACYNRELAAIPAKTETASVAA